MQSSNSRFKKQTSALFSLRQSAIVNWVLYAFSFIFVLNLIIYSALLAKSLYMIDYTIAPHSALYRLLSLAGPPILWIIATGKETLSYSNSKIISFVLTGINECIFLCGIAFQLLSRLFLRHIMSIKTDDIFTKDMVLVLARIATQFPLILLAYLITKSILRPVFDERSRAKILKFRFQKTASNSGKSIEYTMAIAKDLNTGRPIIISENDRYLHTLVDGTSGTGKTSSTILPAVYGDLMMRSNAIRLRKQALSKADGKFNSAIEFKKMLNKRYPVCGITILAPDDSLTDDVCRLCEGHGIPYNRIDATKTPDGTRKANWTGMNPFYVPDQLHGEALHEAIVKKAVIFSDIMLVINDLKGKSDSYFSGLNRQMLTNIAILVMLTVPPLFKRQATPEDLQILINDFDLLPKYANKLEEINKDNGRYTFILQYINNELVGKGRAKMEDQSRGTRNIINEFLMMPGSRDVYCSQESLDFDKILSDGEVTVCNYDLASGDTNAIAFGLFFLLTFNNAVLSRPGTEQTRSPHFFYVDELPVLIHSSLEKNFSLFRKFRVAMFCAIQTLDQFEKNELTKYLKGVILGCANIFVFGRSSVSDMEVFSTMAGVTEKAEEQKTISETALSDDSPSLSYSSREMWTQKNLVEGIDIRMKDFQVVTLFTIRNGAPLPPIQAKVSFLKPSDWASTTKNKTKTTHTNSSEFHTTNLHTKTLLQHNFMEGGEEFACMHNTLKKDIDSPPDDKPEVTSSKDSSESISDLF